MNSPGTAPPTGEWIRLDGADWVEVNVRAGAVLAIEEARDGSEHGATILLAGGDAVDVQQTVQEVRAAIAEAEGARAPPRET